MRLLVNTATVLKGGGLQVANSFLHELIGFKENEYHVFLSKTMTRQINRDSFPKNFTFYDIPHRPGSGMRAFLSSRKLFDELERKVKPDCIFTTSGPSYWRPKAPHLMGFNLPHFVYPDSPYLKNIPLYRKLRWRFKTFSWAKWFFNQADGIVVQTDDVNERLKKLFGIKKVHTVSNTCSAHYYDYKIFPNKLPVRFENEIRLVCISSFYYHKNLGIINKIASILKARGLDNIRFVLTLPEDSFQNEFNDEAKRIIYNVGPVKVNECPSLYRECDMLFLPTLLECFSASYPEAMLMEKPILTSDMSFARTVCRDAAVYFDPMNPNNIIDKIEMLVNSKEIQNELIEKGKERVRHFNSATERAEVYLKICESYARNGSGKF
ncbi:MAG: glycosyltransferase [Ignavibacteria bacterium]|nr:glycosyltransferase [Ignavibacteria bacterium]